MMLWILISLLFVQTFAQNLTLVQVQVITRHGARSPFGDIPNYPAYWNCSLTELEIPSKSISSSVSLHRIYRKNYITDEEVLLGDCPQGQLTYYGFMDHFLLGQTLRSTYVDKLGFLPTDFDPELFYIRSTDSARTFQSAEAQFLGLYPPETRSDIDVIDIYTVESSVEILLPSLACPALVDLCNQVQNTTQWIDNLDSMNPLKEQLMQAWNASEIPFWIGLFGILESRLGNDIDFPPGVDQATYEKIVNFVVWELETLYAPKEICRLGIGRFIEEIHDNMLSYMDGNTQPKWFLYSAHDVTLAFILSAFDVFEGTGWPEYANHAIFELYSSDDGDYFVQLLYQGEPILIPGCPNTICPFSVFESIATTLIPKNWSQECGIGRPRSYYQVNPEAAEVTEFFC